MCLIGIGRRVVGVAMRLQVITMGFSSRYSSLLCGCYAAAMELVGVARLCNLVAVHGYFGC